MSTVTDEFTKLEKLMGDKAVRAKLSIPQKIEMYGLWCVATRGKCDRPKPSRTRLLEYGKWAAWKKYEKLGKEEARKKFVENAKKLLASSKL